MDYYPRKLMLKLDKLIKRPEIIVLKGPRQSGKTTLLRMLQKKLKNTSYVSFEDMDERDAFGKRPKLFMKRFVGKKYLFFDEVQYVDNVGQKLKLVMISSRISR